jgi:hypothetical protein
MVRASSVLALSLVLAACSGGSAAPIADGPVHLGVLSGNNQSVSAAPASANTLPAQVVAQVVRLPNGQVAMTTRVVDAILPPKAWAQTAVNGIAGAVVCAVSPDPKHGLTPEVPCTNTDAAGKAYFTFHADTLAGVSKAEVRGTVAGVTQVSDSVTATVMPDPASLDFWGGPAFSDTLHQVYAHQAAGNATADFYSVHVGDTLDLTGFIAKVQDKYNNVLGTYTLSWAVTQISTAPFTTSGKMGDWLYWPPAWTLASAATGTGSKVTGFAPGYASVTVFVNGQRMRSSVRLAVF